MNSIISLSLYEIIQASKMIMTGFLRFVEGFLGTYLAPNSLESCLSYGTKLDSVMN